MKFNWGTGIVIAMVLFMIFIIQFAVRMMSENIDLVADDYYHQEIHYQERINNINAAAQAGKIQVEDLAEEITVAFPASFAPNSIEGKIVLYKPNNALLDRNFDFVANGENNYTITLSKEKLIKGKYTLQVEAQSGESQYYWEEKLFLRE